VSKILIILALILGIFIGDILLPALFLFPDNQLVYVILISLLMYFGFSAAPVIGTVMVALIYEISHGLHPGTSALALTLAGFAMYFLGKVVSLPAARAVRGINGYAAVSIIGLVLLIIFQYSFILLSLIFFRTGGFDFWPNQYLSFGFQIYAFIAFNILFRMYNINKMK